MNERLEKECAAWAHTLKGSYGMHVTTQTGTRHIGELCVGGDWACAHGDLEALHYVAQNLADCAPKSLHDELIALAKACYRDPDRAVKAWCQVKKKIQRPAS